jgi:hypothetical protein
LSAKGTQGLVDIRYRLLRTGALLVLALDVFYFFACYLAATTSHADVLSFEGFLSRQASDVLPILLRYTVLGYAVVSLPMVIHGRRLALMVRAPRDSSGGISSATSVEAAFHHYRHTYRIMLLLLTIVNLSAASYFIAYGDFWIVLPASCVGFLNKLVVFPGPRGFNRWMWRVLELTSRSSGT